MGNFIETFNLGLRGAVKGIPFGTGLEQITLNTNGITRGKIFGVAGPEKSGKSTFVDYAFVIQTFIYCKTHNIDVAWHYYSFEIDRVSKEFDFMCFWLNYRYGIENIDLPPGRTRNGKNTVPLDSDYLKGIMLDDNFNNITVNPDLLPYIQSSYVEFIVPLFGEYSAEGICITKGLINFIEFRDNPTGLYKNLIKEAEKEGKIRRDGKERLISYEPNVPGSYRIVIVDHMRKLNVERGWQLKQTIDKMSEYMVILRNVLQYTFVPIIHTNRSLGSVDKLNFLKGDIYPTSDDLKDTGNLGEDCNYLFTTFNPNDDKYALKEHFGVNVRDSKGNILNKNFKSIHLVASRHCEFPRHYGVNMIGNLKKFEKLQ